MKCGKNVTKAFVNHKALCLVSISNLNSFKSPIKCPFYFASEKSAVARAAVVENSELETKSRKELPTYFEALAKRDVDTNMNLPYLILSFTLLLPDLNGLVNLHNSYNVPYLSNLTSKLKTNSNVNLVGRMKARNSPKSQSVLTFHVSSLNSINTLNDRSLRNLPNPTKLNIEFDYLPRLSNKRIELNITCHLAKIESTFRNGRHLSTMSSFRLRRSNDVESNPGPKRESILVITHNVRGLGDEKKLRHLLHYLQQRKSGKNLDFISCLQETYIEKAGKIPYIWRGNYFLTPGNGHSCGCLTLLSPHLNILDSRNLGSRGHILACQKSGDQGVTYIVANIYAPNPNSNEKIEFFNGVFDVIAEFQERHNCENLFVMGDFNLTFKASEMRNRNYTMQEQRVARIVKSRIEELELKDIWDSYVGFTWRRPNTDTFSTIDRILYTSRTLGTEKSVENWALSCSDHAAVETSFFLVEAKIRNRSKITRLDPSLAKETWSKLEIERKFNEMFATVDVDWDPHMKLEFAKVCIRSVVEQTQAERKRNEKSEEDEINEELDTAIAKLGTGALTGNRKLNLIDHVEHLRNRKQELVNLKGERLATRLGTKWYNEGEKSTRYFLRLLNRAIPDDFKSITSSAGEGEVTDPERIEAEIVQYYRKLYESYDKTELITMENDDEFFKELNQVSVDESRELTKPISLAELTSTLHTCRDSAPGPDGIPYSILGLLWPIYGNLLLDAWNHSVRIGNLPPSHKVSYLKLIPKVGKDLKELTNWRPITLSNCDHKLITKSLANRLCKAASPVIRDRQTAYLKGRLINDNIRAMLSTINITNLEERCEGLLISLDAKKAFDSVEHSYIERCLKELGCESFIPVLRLLYSELETSINVNGRIVKGFRILRGVKQGDSLSCILFIICMEPLLRNIECNVDIAPITSEALGNLPKVYAYADDVNGTINDTPAGVQAVFSEYEKLTKRSGLWLNADKTEVMRLGINEPKTFNVMYMGQQFEIRTKNKIKINGVLLQRDERALVEENVRTAMTKMDKFFRAWSRRNLSTLGRIVITKTFGISQLIFLMQSLELKSEHFKAINALLYKYIWNRHYLAAKAPERIKREIMTKPINKGGYGMLDIVALDDSLKLKALGRLATSSHPFLMLLKDKCNFEDFFQPSCPNRLESVLNKGIELLKLDRDKLWDNKFLKNSTSLLQEIKTMSIGKVVNQQGRLSIPFFLIRRRGVTRIADLTPRDLNELERYIENRKLPLIRQARMLPPLNNVTDIKMSIAIKGVFKELGRCTSKEIRESRMSLDPILEYKLGVTLTSAEAASWGYKLSKLTSIRHRVTLLRVAHGEFYTKDKLHRYNLTDDNSCPRCGEVETLVHKFVECEYIARIWQYASLTSNYPSASNGHRQVTYKSILGGHVESTMTVLTLNAEILLKISYLKDEQNYLVHPKTFVKNCLKAIERNERKTKIKEEIKALLQI